jgi:hypothetical protein
MPGIVEEDVIPAVMGNQDAPELGSCKQLALISRAFQTSVMYSDDVVIVFPKKV